MCDCGPVPDDAALVTDFSSGDTICVRCGVVVESHVLDESAEWKTAEVEDKRRRPPPPKHAKWRAAEPADAVAEMMRVIDMCACVLGLSTSSNAATWAKELYRDLHEAKPLRGESKAVYATAAMYFGCKLAGAARELRFVSGACGVDIGSLNDAVAAFKDRLVGKSYHAKLFEAVQAGMLINMYADRLPLDGADDMRRIKRAAHIIDEQLLATLDCSRAPRTVCSGILWLAAQRERIAVSKKAVAAACGVCIQSVDKMVAELNRCSLS